MHDAGLGEPRRFESPDIAPVPPARPVEPPADRRDAAIKDLQELLAGARRELAHREEYVESLQAHLREEVAWRDEVIAELQAQARELAESPQAQELAEPVQAQEPAEPVQAQEPAESAPAGELAESAPAGELAESAPADVEAAEQTLKEQAEHLEALAAQVELMTSREDHLREMLVDAHRQLLQRDAEIAHLHHLRNELDAAYRELEEARAFIAHVRASRFWRLASAYWSLGNWLRRLAGR